MIRVYWRLDILTTGKRESLGLRPSWAAALATAEFLTKQGERVELVQIGRLP
jgi:hypothetical protein